MTHPSEGWPRWSTLVVLVVVVASSCVSPTHPVYNYEVKAAVALKNAESSAGAAYLATQQVEAGRSTEGLFAVLAGQAEENASHATSAFDTRQPPGTRGDEIRAKVLPVLEEITSVLTDVRIAAFRGDIPAAVEAAEPLPELIAKSEDLAKELRR